MRIIWIIPLVAFTSCIAESEQSRQQEAVEYQMQQHDSAKCADAGLLPGSDGFRKCMAELANAPPSQPVVVAP